MKQVCHKSQAIRKSLLASRKCQITTPVKSLSPRASRALILMTSLMWMKVAANEKCSYARMKESQGNANTYTGTRAATVSVVSQSANSRHSLPVSIHPAFLNRGPLAPWGCHGRPGGMIGHQKATSKAWVGFPRALLYSNQLTLFSTHSNASD